MSPIGWISILFLIALFIFGDWFFKKLARKFPHKEREKKERKDEPRYPARGETITVTIGKKKVKAVLLDDPNEKPKQEKPQYLPRYLR